MRKLYYNPIEPAAKVHIVSKCFNIDLYYTAFETCEKGYPIMMDDLFDLAKCSAFEVVDVLFTEHEQGFAKGKAGEPAQPVVGWVPLKVYKNGGGYLKMGI